MHESRTVPLAPNRFEIPTLRVEVVDGPDRGKSAVASGETMSIGTADGNELIVTDKTVSRFHLQLSIHSDGGISAMDQGSTNGTFAGAIRVERAVLPPGASVRIGQTTLALGRGDKVSVELYDGSPLEGLVGNTPSMRRLFAQIDKAARSDASVLVVGESGTGKENIARALHERGPRASKPFVTVDCGSLSPTLVASELFGHERGAFTGAERQHAGAFERADGGTLFLDEIGELPAGLQATLLGALERRRFRRLGGSREIATDVRIVSATNRDLRAEVNTNTFRLDLYYRLAVIVLQVPPLRERVDDIPVLVEHFLRECGHHEPVEHLVSPASMKTLLAHRWPGNVRELRNLVEATVAMGEAPTFAADGARVEAKVQDDAFKGLFSLPYRDARAAVLNKFEREYVGDLLRRTHGNVSKASRDAQLDRSHLTDLIRRHRLKEP